MLDKSNKSAKITTIQDIAIKLVKEQEFDIVDSKNSNNSSSSSSGNSRNNNLKERTIFIFGSKGVGKSTLINKFFEREENVQSTLALDYYYCRRSGGSTQDARKQLLNIWELGGSTTQNAESLVQIPLRLHNATDNFAAIIMIDLTSPQKIWLELEAAYKSLKIIAQKFADSKQKAADVVNDDDDLERNVELLPFPVLLVGGKYDLFMNLEPETKKHVCCCFRSMAHLLGAALLFYSVKIPKLFKILRDTISHLGFGSPLNPFRALHITDYNEAIAIWFRTDNWSKITTNEILNFEQIGWYFVSTIKQQHQEVEIAKNLAENPSRDAGFRESIIDELRAQKDEELQIIAEQTKLINKFEVIND